MKEGYVPKAQRKKILLLCDDIRMTSGVATMAREIVVGTSHRFNWVNLGGAIKNLDEGKLLDLSTEANKYNDINDSSVFIYPISGYGNQDIIRQLIKIERPDAIMIFTDPRYWIWLFQMEQEIRKQIPIIYLNIWDNLPYPMYNKPFYESCDALFAISKQTENINRVVLGETADEKIIKYIPHGINENIFFPITKEHPEYPNLQKFKNELYNGKEYDFTMLYNARNIRRKCIPDLMLAYKLFIDVLDEDKARKCAFVLHTQLRDENGTDLLAVHDMLFGNNDKYNIIFSESRLPSQTMNLLYNATDVTALVSSNEGWGLSLTEAMMCGKPIIANVTGGMQDQMRFRTEDDKWIEFTEEFGSNHRGKYSSSGEWSFPVFPSNISIVGSIPTPYIFDDRANPEDISHQIYHTWTIKTNWPEQWERIGALAHEWVTSDESMMSATNMCKNIINGIDETLGKFQPRYAYEFIPVRKLEQPNHFNKYPVAE
jgi:glycosyltransferase involved in cell wall biosynthesis